MIKSISNFLSDLNSANQQRPQARSAAPEVAAVVPKLTTGRDLAIHLPASLQSPN